MLRGSIWLVRLGNLSHGARKGVPICTILTRQAIGRESANSGSYDVIIRPLGSLRNQVLCTIVQSE